MNRLGHGVWHKPIGTLAGIPDHPGCVRDIVPLGRVVALGRAMCGIRVLACDAVPFVVRVRLVVDNELAHAERGLTESGPAWLRHQPVGVGALTVSSVAEIEVHRATRIRLILIYRESALVRVNVPSKNDVAGRAGFGLAMPAGGFGIR
jgi:hypothetical protein